MINDVITSGRGPGIVGTLLAIIVLGGFSGLALMVLNDDSADPITLKDLLADQESELALYDEKMEVQKARLNAYRVLQDKVSELMRLKNKEELEGQRLEAVVKKGAQVQAEIDEVNQEFEDYKVSYRKNERALWKGRTVDLSSTKGPEYKNAVITAITPLQLRVRIDRGPKSVPFQELPPEIVDQLQFDEKEANEYLLSLEDLKRQQAGEIRKWNEEKKEAQAEAAAALKIRRKQDIRRLIIEREGQIVERRKEISHWRKQASYWRSKQAEAKRSGRMSINQGKLREAEAKERAASRAVDLLRVKIKQLQAELRK